MLAVVDFFCLRTFIPMHAYPKRLELWNLGGCIDGNAVFLGGEILNCVLDFAIILLPVRIVRKLKLPLAEKIILCFIFIMGSL